MVNDRIWHTNPTTNKPLDHPVSVRVLEVRITYSEVETENPLIIKNTKGNLLQAIATCERNQKLFNYENEFKGEKRRWIMVSNEGI